jgi:hypothetical protein
MNENAPNGLESAVKQDPAEEGFSTKLKALEEALEEANATFDGAKAGKIQEEINALHRAADAKYMVGAPETVSPLVTEATEEKMGPPKELFNKNVLETSEARKNAEAYIPQDLESIAKAMQGGESMDANGFASKVNSIGAELERLWQGRVKRELSGSSEFGEDYKKALTTPEAQAIYDEELAKFDGVLGNTSLKTLSDALHGVRVANYRRLDEDEMGAKLAAEQVRRKNAARNSDI